MSVTRNLSFRGVGIKHKFELVLAFQTMKREDSFEQLAWRVIKVPAGDSDAGTVTYEAQLAVSTTTLVNGIVTTLGHLKPMKLGERVELRGSGEDLDWQNVTTLGGDLQSDIWFDNFSDKRQDVTIVLSDPKAEGPAAPILVTSVAKGFLAKATFKPALSAYTASNYKGGQLTVKVNGVIDSFKEVDLTKLKETTTFKITEDESTGIYTIAADK